MTIDTVLTIAATLTIVAVICYFHHAFMAVKYEKQFFDTLARQLHADAIQCEADKQGELDAARAHEDRIRMERASQWIDDDIKRDNDRLRAALDLIPIKDVRSITKERKDYEARQLIATTDLATLEAAISEREPIPNIAPTVVANLEAAKARIAAAHATKAEAEARLAVSMAPRASNRNGAE